MEKSLGLLFLLFALFLNSGEGGARRDSKVERPIGIARAQSLSSVYGPSRDPIRSSRYWKPLVGEHRNPPLFCTLRSDWQAVDAERAVDSFSNKDTLLEHQLYLLSDSVGQPRLFYADILTPVCIDGICKPVYIELYWDLTGGYAGYGIYEDKPLTKFDHDAFLPADYEKMNRLLADNNSVLRRKELSDLFDDQAENAKRIEYQGEKLDAVSGATKKEIKESIVEGALYSCYTLWHLVHGEAARDIEHYLDSIYTEELEARFLFTDYEPYYFHALKTLGAGDFDKYRERIAEIFAAARPVTRTYILKKMPFGLLTNEAIGRKFYQLFEAVDINTRTLLIDHLPQAHPIATELLAAHLEVMTKNQLKNYLDALPTDRSKLSSTVLKNLQLAAKSQEYAYGYLIAEWLN